MIQASMNLADGFARRNPTFVQRVSSDESQRIRALYSVRKAMDAYRELHPYCEYTGRMTDLHVHHLYPVSVAPKLAEDPENMMVLCRQAHFWVAHRGDWKIYTPNMRQIAAIARLQRTVGV